MDDKDELRLMREMAALEVKKEALKLQLKAEIKAKRQEINALENRRRGILADIQSGQGVFEI